jgi:phosphatidylglycerol:prolipoprotein diacylglycerol transferase
VHKIAFQLGSFTIHWYGVLLAVGFVLGLWTASRRAQRYGIAPEHILDGGIWLIGGAIIGARALYAISYWPKLMEDPLFPGAPWTEVFMVQRGGLVFYGGLLGAIASGIFYTWRKDIPVWSFGDAMAPSIALGYVPGRLGCLMNGCCFGRPSALPWAVHFPADHDTHGVGVHPTQVYDSLLNLALYACLAWIYRRKQFDGQVFSLYLLGYALTRSTAELFRGDYVVRYLGGTATPAHLMSAMIFAGGLVLYLVLSRTQNGVAKPRIGS